MTVAKVWNGTAWEAVAGGVSQAQLDAQTARIDALEISLRIIPVTNVLVVTLPQGNVAYTTVDLAAYLPVTAKAAVFTVVIGGTRTLATFATNSVDFRRDALSPTSGLVGVACASTGSVATGQQTLQQFICPLSARTFQYSKTDGLNSSSGGSITLVGYVV